MDYLILVFILIVNIITSRIAIWVGYTIDGAIIEQSVTADAPAIANVLGWIWDNVTFLFNMCTFQVDSIPAMVSLVFIAMQLLVGYILIKLVRGN